MVTLIAYHCPFVIKRSFRWCIYYMKLQNHLKDLIGKKSQWHNRSITEMPHQVTRAKRLYFQMHWNMDLWNIRWKKIDMYYFGHGLYVLFTDLWSTGMKNIGKINGFNMHSVHVTVNIACNFKVSVSDVM